MFRNYLLIILIRLAFHGKPTFKCCIVKFCPAPLVLLVNTIIIIIITIIIIIYFNFVNLVIDINGSCNAAFLCFII